MSTGESRQFMTADEYGRTLAGLSLSTVGMGARERPHPDGPRGGTEFPKV